MVSALDKAKRALVVLVRALALTYKCAVLVGRDSPDKDVEAAHRKLSRHLQPGQGSAEDQQRLRAAHEAWEAQRRGAPGRGGKRTKAPAVTGAQQREPQEQGGRQAYRIASEAVLLTYQGVTGVDQWLRLNAFVRSSLTVWRVKYWCSTCEQNADGGYHAHIMVQFTQLRDCSVKNF